MSGALLPRYQHMTNHPLLSGGSCTKDGVKVSMILSNCTCLCSSCTAMSKVLLENMACRSVMLSCG